MKKKLGYKAIYNRLNRYFDMYFGEYSESAAYYEDKEDDTNYFWTFLIPETKKTIQLCCNKTTGIVTEYTL